MTTDTTAPGLAGASPALAQLVERDEITRLVYRLGACLDEGLFEGMRDLFVDDAVASTPGGVAEGIDALIAQASRNHPADAAIQHLITNVLVDLEGDRATVRANLLVTFGRPDPDADAPSALAEVYNFVARRSSSGWRLARVAVRPVWASHVPLVPVGRPGD
ncbi:MAG TPA: nuclear transport factor 2 family protein [Acidimicrobiales bacterium]|nr:nuclear transport factor 2 family protein [Acidimicrobiales bacterium]